MQRAIKDREKITHSHLAHATIIIAFFSLLSKLTGLLRLNVLTSQFDSGDQLDIFYAAFRAPDFIFNLLILGTLSAAFIPVFCEYLVKNPKIANELASSILNLTLVVIGALSAILIIFAPLLVSLIVPGFNSEKQIAVTELTRIMALASLFFSLSSVFSSILNSHKKFTIVAAVPVVYNLAIIFGALVFYPRFGLSGLAWGVVLGAFLHLVLQIPQTVALGFRWKPVINFRLRGITKIAKLYLPRVFGMDSSQISLLISTVLGSTLAAGSITFYSLAYDLQSIPLGVIAVSFAVVAFPTLSDAYAKNDRKTFREIFNINLSQILYIIIPLSALMLILRAQIVRLVFGRGEFGWTETIATISVFGFFVISLFAQSLIPLFARAFYAMHNTVVPVILGFITTVINIALALILTQIYSFGVSGLAIAFSVSVLANLMMLFTMLEIRFGNLVDFELVYKILKIAAGTILMGIFSYASLYAVAPVVDTHTILGLLIQTLVAFLVGLGVYLASGSVLDLAESRHLIITGRLWLKKIVTAFTRFPGL